MRALAGIILAARPAEDDLTAIAGDSAPQALPVANRPVVCHALDALRVGGVDDVAVIVSPGTERSVAGALEAAGENARLIRVDDAGTLASAVASAEDFIAGRPVALLPGDGLMLDPLRPLAESWEESGSDLLALCRRGARDAGNVRDLDAARILRLVGEGSPAPSKRMLAGTYLLSPHAVRLASSLAGTGRETIADTIAALLDSGGALETETAGSSWQYSGTVDGLLEANRLVLDGIEREVEGADIDSARVEGRVSVHPTAVLDRATIRGPAVIGAGAVLVDTFVGPYTAIGNGVRLDGAEVEYSVILDGAEIRHPGRRIESSLIGRAARVSRDFSMPSALRLRLGPGAEVSLS